MTDKQSKQPGLVVASFGQRGLVETGAGDTSRYVLRGRKLRVVCGDNVTWSAADHGTEVIVETVLERRNTLARPGNRGDAEVLAANLDQLLVVVASEPAPDFFLLDRFLCAAELMQVTVAIVRNKTDLSSSPEPEFLEYADLGYVQLHVSAETGSDIDALRAHLVNGVSILVGQSGVGKSSLLNRLLPDAEARVSALSEASGEGRHTTTAAIMHQLEDGGRLIDSPGVRDFVPAIDQRAKIQSGFREIVALADNCRFTDCHHLREPACAVQEAVEQGRISPRRYESYKRLHNLTG